MIPNIPGPIKIIGSEPNLVLRPPAEKYTSTIFCGKKECQ